MKRLNILLLFCCMWCSVLGYTEQTTPDSPNIRFIWPTIPFNGTLSCPSDANEQRCYSLQETVANRSVGAMIFQSNTKVVFLPGIHVLEFSDPIFVNVQNVENLTLEGDDNVTTGQYGLPEPSTKVLCKTPVGFAFFSATNLSLVNLTMSGCGANISDMLFIEALVILSHGVHVVGKEQKAALFLVNIHDLHIEHCSVQSSSGFGVLGVNTLGNTTINQSIFLANNLYVLSLERCQFNPIDNSDYTACNGGNMLLVFEDVFNCPSEKVQYSLTISNSVFALGITTFAGYLSEMFLTRGTGFGAILSQSSYGIDIILDSVSSYGNGAVCGANFYFGVYEVVRNSSITLTDCSSSNGNNILVRIDNFLQVSEGVSAGLHLEYGTSAPDSSPRPVCSGAVSLPREILRVSSSTFTNNSAVTAAGMYISLNLNDRILGSTGDGEALVRVLVENCTFTENQGLRGAGIFISETKTINTQAKALVMITNTTFTRNGYTPVPVRNLTGITVDYRYSVFEMVSTNLSMTDTKFISNEGSAMSLFASTALINGQILFDSNSGIRGGAMDLDNSYIYLRPNTNITFINNFALQTGGAINTVSREDIRLPCFYQVHDPDFLIDPNISLYFEGNYAQEAGSVLYGGSIDSCYVEATSYFSGQSSTYVFDQITTIGYHSNDSSLISSEAIRLCSCTSGLPDCTLGVVNNARVYPGGTFMTSAVAVGQRNGTTPAIIYSTFNPGFGKTGSISPLQSIQQAGKLCSNFTFTVQTDSSYSTIVLIPSSGNLIVANNLNLVINVILLSCPTGFILQNGTCICDPVPQIANYNLECNLEEQTVRRLGGSWVNATYANNGTYSGLIVHESCPYDYCTSDDSDIDLTDPDAQCNFNRTGILCGACKSGLSIPLATSQCKKCSDAYLSLILAYALAGATLVALLFVLNLTLSMGTLGGLIFYANIVHINQSIFFPPGSLNAIVVFIAWINLDPGTDYCFFDGMDSYVRTWLTYVFPIYIWFIVGVIILVSRYSTHVAKICGSTAVPVLATLILLSYTKLLQAVLFSLSSTAVLLPDNSFRIVWSLDGNIEFLKGKHIALGVFGNLLLLLFLIPYALFLILAPTPCGQYLTKYRLLKWINKLKPFLDAHTGHYRDHYRYWTGLLLLVRVVIAIFVSLNLTNITAAPLLIVAIIMFMLIATAWSGGGVYRTWPRNLLECSFFLNLGIFAVSSMFVLKIGGNQEALFYISGTTALLEFLGILVYHVYHQAKKLRRVKQCMGSTEVAMCIKKNKNEGENVDLVESTHKVTHTTVGLREPLLEN